METYLYYAMLGLGLTCLSGQLLAKAWFYGKEKNRQLKVKSIIQEAEDLADDTSILSLDHRVDYYEARDITMEKSNNRLFLNFPRDLLPQLREIDDSFIFRQDISLDGSGSFQDLARETGIADLLPMIEKHRRSVAKEFIEKARSGEITANYLKSGVNNLKFGERYDDYDRWVLDHKSGLQLLVFETDYFTHLVFQSIYQELYRQGHPIASSPGEELINYRAFLTNFRINTFLLLDSQKGEVIVFGKEPDLQKQSQSKGKWNVTLDKELTPADCYCPGKCILNCIFQDLEEELGLEAGHREYLKESKFYDLFLDRETFQLGITSFVKLDLKYEDLFASQGSRNKLKKERIVVVPFNGEALYDFVVKNRENVTNSCLFTLNMITARTLLAIFVF